MMQPVSTASEMRELDRIAIEERGVSSIRLMERAAWAVAGQVARCLEQGVRASAPGVIGPRLEPGDRETWPVSGEGGKALQPRVAVFAGPGNNGGDGIGAARFLLEQGMLVRVFLVGDQERLTPDTKEMARRFVAADGAVEQFLPQDMGQTAWLSQCDAAVDALFGVGLAREVTGAFLQAVECMNRLAAPVVACDIPSGIDADTGKRLAAAVRAQYTVTFTHAKPGHFLGDGAEFTGQLEIEDIGIPADLCARGRQGNCSAVGPMDVRLPRRKRNSHKGDYGAVSILAGAVGYTGAPVLAAHGAVRGGAGLVRLYVPQEIYHIAAVKCDSAMPCPLPECREELLEPLSRSDALLIGPGLGRAPQTQELVRFLLTALSVPVVLDADGINALCGHIDILDGRSAPTILTPHDGEFSRLSGCALPVENRLATARAFAQAHGCTLVLKGHRTLTTLADGTQYLNTTGNPGMAKGGSGDILAGIIAALLGQGFASGSAAWRGVVLHGLAGDLAAEELGEYAMTPSDLLDFLPRAIKCCTNSSQ